MTREQFINFVRAEQERLRRFLLALCCGRQAEADDMAQDALMKAYLACDTYDDCGRFAAWLYKIAYNVFLDYRRRHRPMPSVSEALEVEDKSQRADAQFQYEALHKALAQLPDRERYAILLFYMSGYEVKEIAQITDSSADAVKKQLQRGREHLRTLMER